jgi:hypothetical protein
VGERSQDPSSIGLSPERPLAQIQVQPGPGPSGGGGERTKASRRRRRGHDVRVSLLTTLLLLPRVARCRTCPRDSRSAPVAAGADRGFTGAVALASRAADGVPFQPHRFLSTSCFAIPHRRYPRYGCRRCVRPWPRRAGDAAAESVGATRLRSRIVPRPRAGRGPKPWSAWVQTNRGAGWMPWRRGPMKDVATLR